MPLLQHGSRRITWHRHAKNVGWQQGRAPSPVANLQRHNPPLRNGRTRPPKKSHASATDVNACEGLAVAAPLLLAVGNLVLWKHLRKELRASSHTVFLKERN